VAQEGSQGDSKLYLYHEDEFSGEFDISQSPNPASSVYREAFYDTGNPNKYVDGFGTTIAMSDEQIVVGASGNAFNYVFYPFDFFDIQFNNLEASDGTFEDTKISWTLSGCNDCQTEYIDSIRIFRNSELIGLLEPTEVEFFDNPFDLIPSASDPIAGKNYIYEAEVKVNSPGGFSSERFGDTGFAKRQGKVSGDVFVTGTSTGVPAVDITLTGLDTDDNVVYEYNTTTLSDGSFLMQDIYLGASGITYFIKPTFQDHSFLSAQNDSILLTPNTPEKSNLIFFDNTAYVVYR